MEIYFKGQYKQRPEHMLRSAGFYPIFDRRSGKESFVRRLGKEHYPRFHIYVKEYSVEQIHINLHLDMKKESYGGVSAHSGEYDSENVKEEAYRIAKYFKEQKIKKEIVEKEEKKGFLGNLFG